MKKVQFEIGNGKLNVNLVTAPCEVTLVKVVAISDEALRLTVEIPSRQREDFMDWCVNNRFQFLMTGMSFQNQSGETVRVGQADAEEAFGWMRTTDLDLLDRTHHADELIRQSFIDQVD